MLNRILASVAASRASCLHRPS